MLFISWDGMTDPLGQSQVIPYLQGLTKLGFQFTLLSFEKAEKLKQRRDFISGILKESNIDWRPITFHRNPPILAKLYDKWNLARLIRNVQKEKNFALIHCRSFIATDAALKISQKNKIPILNDMRGFWVDERVDSGHWNMKSLFYRVIYKKYKAKERKHLISSAHIISLTNKGKIELIKNYQVPADKISVIPCCVDLDHFNYLNITDKQKCETKKQLGIGQDVKVLSYLGSLGGWYLTGEMLDFFVRLKLSYPTAKFLVITHQDPESIHEMSREKGLRDEDIVVCPAERKDVPLYLSLSDWSIFFIKDAYSKIASSPTKQGEIMAMGVPLICNDIGDSGIIVESSGAGIVLNQLNDTAFDKAIEQLNASSGMSKAGIREGAIKYFDLQTAISSYHEAYQHAIL